ncbi:MAG TPA: LysR family transcriptional regulator [Isosphaeraceae bacterium]|nr:LysR family transcriptional regulator [Isosphaeraceae bacterium]
MSRPRPPKPESGPVFSNRVRPRIKVWLEAEDGSGFGSGLVAILQEVERTGSIKAAADGLGRSYRHVWDRIKEAERAFGFDLVQTQVGGQGSKRSTLSDEARRLVADFLALKSRMIQTLEEIVADRREPRS